jgi:hypothetical protein
MIRILFESDNTQDIQIPNYLTAYLKDKYAFGLEYAGYIVMDHSHKQTTAMEPVWQYFNDMTYLESLYLVRQLTENPVPGYHTHVYYRNRSGEDYGHLLTVSPA